jgi:hypothetical protein
MQLKRAGGEGALEDLSFHHFDYLGLRQWWARARWFELSFSQIDYGNIFL